MAPIGASHQGWIGPVVSGDWHFLGAVGPLAGALLVGRSARARTFLSAAWIRWRVSPWLYLAALSPLLFLAPPAEIAAQAVVIALGAVFLTWLYNSTGGSILLVAIWHFTHSVVHIAAPEVSVSWETWSGVLSTILAVAVAVIWRRGLSTSGVAVAFASEEGHAGVASIDSARVPS